MAKSVTRNELQLSLRLTKASIRMIRRQKRSYLFETFGLTAGFELHPATPGAPDDSIRDASAAPDNPGGCPVGPGVSRGGQAEQNKQKNR